MSKPSPMAVNGRRSDGTFAAGHKFARGNPLAQRVQKLRVELVKAIGKGDLAAIIFKMIDLAKNGDVQAAKLVFDRAIGAPVEADLIERLARLEQTIGGETR